MRSTHYSPGRIASRQAATGVALFLCMAIIASTSAIVAIPESGLAENAKCAIPSIEKAIAGTTGTYGPSTETSTGKTVRYRLSASMPENVEELASLTYLMEDEPDDRIAPNSRSVEAYIVDARGRVKRPLAPTIKRANRRFAISLGDIKQACPDLKFGDKAVVKYTATVSPTAEPGDHPNVARLRYDDGTGMKQTVEVKAVAIIPSSPRTPEGQPPSTLPKTGDGLSPMAVFAVLICSGLVGIAARIRQHRAGKRQDKTWSPPRQR